MRLPTFTKASFDQFPGYPPWFHRFFEIINPFIDNVQNALRGNLTFANNFRCQVIALEAVHDQVATFALTLRSRPALVLPGAAAVPLAEPVFWTADGTGRINIRMRFVGAPTTPVQVTVFILGD